VIVTLCSICVFVSICVTQTVHAVG
jgi:hypothetical protein